MNPGLLLGVAPFPLLICSVSLSSAICPGKREREGGVRGGRRPLPTPGVLARAPRVLFACSLTHELTLSFCRCVLCSPCAGQRPRAAAEPNWTRRRSVGSHGPLSPPSIPWLFRRWWTGVPAALAVALLESPLVPQG